MVDWRAMLVARAALCGAAVLFSGAGPVVADDPARANVLWYDRPAQRWVEALPVGNGRLGAMIFGGTAEERLQLNEDTLWSGGPRHWNNADARRWLPLARQAIFAGRYFEADQLAKNMQGPYTQSYQPLGDLRLSFKLDGQPENYYRELDLNCAVARTRFKINGVTYARDVFASFPDQVIVLALQADQPGKISFSAKLSSPLRHETKPAGENRVMLRGRGPVQVEPNYRDIESAVVYDERPDGEGMRFNSLLQALAAGGQTRTDEAGALYVENADRVVLLLSASTSFNGFNKLPGSQGVDANAKALQFLEAASQRDAASLLDRHVKDYQALFKRMSLDLGPARADLPTDDRVLRYKDGGDPGLAALVFQFGRYLLIASSRPGGQPANLQGLWNEHVRPPWSSNWTININSEMNYWPAQLTNLDECHQPMLRFISELAVNGRETAQTNYGARGWCAHHNSDLWRQSAPVGAYGQGEPRWANFAMGGVWHCMDLWERFAFTQDRNYLRDFAYPLMKGAAEFCLDWLIEDPAGGGRLVTAPAYSAENAFFDEKKRECFGSMASTQDMALIWDLFTNCIAASELLNVDADFREQLRQARARLYPYQIGKRGQLQEWSRDFDEPEPTHRHLSHLIGLFPGKQITPEQTPDLAQAVRRSLEIRGDDSTGWSMAWKVNLWARLKDGDRAHALIGYLLRLTGSDKTKHQGGGIYPNLFDAHPPFQIDGNFGVTAGIAEMLVQSHRRAEDGRYIIELLPALPKIWPAGRITGARARGGFELDFAWAGGKISAATIRAANGGRCLVQMDGQPVEVELKAGEARTLR